jgi:hypothetical protein
VGGGAAALAMFASAACGRLGFDATSPTDGASPSLDGASSQITFVATGPYTAQSMTTTDIVVAAPTGMQAGDILIAQTWWSNATAVDTIVAAGWTPFSVIQTGTYNSHALFWKRFQDGDNGADFTFVVGPIASTRAGGVVAAYRNVNQTTPIDTAGTACSAGTIAQTLGAIAPAITTSNPGEMVLFIAADATRQITQFPYTGLVDYVYQDSTSGTAGWMAERLLDGAQATSNILETVPNGIDWVATQFAVKASGAIVRKGSGASTHVAGVTTDRLTLHCPAGVSNGDVMLAVVAANYNHDGQLTYASPGWSQINKEFFVYSPTSFLSQFTAVFMNTSGSCTADPVFLGDGAWYGNAVDGVIVNYSGIDTSQPLDAENTGMQTGFSTTCQAQGVTTSYPGDLLLYVAQARPSNDVPGLISSYTQRWFNTVNVQSMLGAERWLPTPQRTEATDAFQGAAGDVYFACHASLQP